jgi:tryptophan synthase alpha chain
VTLRARSRLAQVFAKTRTENRKALVIYLTAGDPDFDTSLRLMMAARNGGADIIELGIPWSDPSADGPAIQAAMERARKTGGGLSATLELCRRIRENDPELPLVLFGYANPIVVRGAAVFAQEARMVGADAMLCVDWPADSDPELANALKAEGLDLISLIAPTSTPSRIIAANHHAGGFLYYISMTGITGGKFVDMDTARSRIDDIRTLTQGRLPVVIGFGISTPLDVRKAASVADGVVIGSAAVRVIENALQKGNDPAPLLEAYVRSLRNALSS